MRLARHSQNAWARHVERFESCRVESSRVEPSGIWTDKKPVTNQGLNRDIGAQRGGGLMTAVLFTVAMNESGSSYRNTDDFCSAEPAGYLSRVNSDMCSYFLSSERKCSSRVSMVDRHVGLTSHHDRLYAVFELQ